jgi:hypothetical protein
MKHTFVKNIYHYVFFNWQQRIIIANIPAEQLQRVNQSLFRWCEERLLVEEQHFQHLL